MSTPTCLRAPHRQVEPSSRSDFMKLKVSEKTRNSKDLSLVFFARMEAVMGFFQVGDGEVEVLLGNSRPFCWRVWG